MDLNLVVLCGRLVTSPDLRVFDRGGRLLRMLLAIRSEHPSSRLDVVPVKLWDPPEDLLVPGLESGARVWVAGMVQRRFWDAVDERRSRLEVVAEQVTVRLGEIEVEAEPGR